VTVTAAQVERQQSFASDESDEEEEEEEEEMEFTLFDDLTKAEKSKITSSLFDPSLKMKMLKLIQD